MNLANLIKGISFFVWVGFFALLAYAVFRASRRNPLPKARKWIIIILVGASVLSTLSSGLVFINPDERGVVISAFAPNGYRSEPLTPGLRWIIPFAETVELYPISKQTYTMSIATYEGQIQGDDSIAARTSDGQQIYVDASVIYHIDPAQVILVHINWQDRYGELIRAQSRGIIRDAVSQYKVEEVNSSKRFQFAQTVATELEKKVAENGLVLDDFVLRNITFSDEYAASVEQKQIAEQQAQQAAFVVEQKKQEAEQLREEAKGKADAAVTEAQGQADARLIEAEAEAQALEMIAEALSGNPDLLNYQYITTLNPNVQVIMVPSGSEFILPYPTTK